MPVGGGNGEGLLEGDFRDITQQDGSHSPRNQRHFLHSVGFFFSSFFFFLPSTSTRRHPPPLPPSPAVSPDAAEGL